MAKILLAAIGLIVSSVTLANKLEPWVEAERHMSTGDFFQSYRILLDLQSKDPQKFLAHGIENYIETLAVLNSTSGLAKECDELTNSSDQKLATKSAYLCGLKFLQLRAPERAETFLARVNKATKFYWPSLILRATADLARNDSERAQKWLQEKDRKNFQSVKLEPLFNITLARLRTSIGKYEEAIRYYQSVTSQDSYYLEALEESAWCFFKLKKPETARVLLDILIPQYQLGKAGATVDASTHFRARYLKAYLALTEQQEEDAIAEFQDLKVDFQKYLKGEAKGLDSKVGVKKIQGDLGYWADIRAMPEELSQQLSLISEWMAPGTSEDLFRQIQLIMALRREQKRIKLNSGTGLETYEKQIAWMRLEVQRRLSSTFRVSVKRLGQSISTLSLKADMGRLEMNWLGRSQGAKSVDEVLAGYKQQTEFIDDYFQ